MRKLPDHIFNKITKVVYSCKTQEQLKITESWAIRVLYTRVVGLNRIYELYRIKDLIKEMRTYLNVKKEKSC